MLRETTIKGLDDFTRMAHLDLRIYDCHHNGQKIARLIRSTRRTLLPLLPSGPGGVHTPSLHGARLIRIKKDPVRKAASAAAG